MDEQNKSQLTEQVVVFELDKEYYAVSIKEVREVVKIPEITPIPRSSDFILGIMNLRGEIVPVIDLEKRFNLVQDNRVVPRHIVVTEIDDMLSGIQVDQVTEVLRIAPKSIRPTPKIITSKITADYLRGVVILDDDRQKSANFEEELEIEDGEELGEQQNKHNSKSKILLLLNLKKILSTDELRIVKESVKDNQKNTEKNIKSED